MFKGQPKGLIAAALANMGERFGFYTMMAILSLFLSAKFGLNETITGVIYAIFYALIYVLALVGGIIADKTKNYKGTILIGIIMMAVGYLIIGFPTPTPVPNLGLYLALTCVGLFTIAFGNGLFKGNLQAVVGQMYDNSKFASKRDTGFQIFYMFINIGAIFAPFFAIAVRNWWLQSHGLAYNAELPALCHQFRANEITGEAMEKFSLAAAEANQGPVADLAAFADRYLDVFNTGFHYAFFVAIIAMVISLVIFLMTRNRLPDVKKDGIATEDNPEAKVTKMEVAEVKRRLLALFAVFGIVIFFWFSFHQNGLSLTFFARDYTDLSMIDIDLGFTRIVGAEMFQSVNPLFVVLLTLLIVPFFSWLNKKGIEPSTPKKIAIGMGIAAAAYMIMTIASVNLPLFSDVKAAGGLEQSAKVGPFILISTYFVLTVAELFISPLGLSFVSKVAPPHMQGLMQGGWLAATAVGNQLLFIGGLMYSNIPLWATWTVFVVVCLISMITMLSMVKWLERVAK
ncbi:MAG: peptide MFS transporter [Bacteroidales bacterium]|nr:peptide MFS transporter [Bacteroidales bacterium]MDD4498882.1 peptide MFS transporter [Bacteroidales bacterium]